jgi:hypothetical protein
MSRTVTLTAWRFAPELYLFTTGQLATGAVFAQAASRLRLSAAQDFDWTMHPILFAFPSPCKRNVLDVAATAASCPRGHPAGLAEA